MTKDLNGDIDHPSILAEKAALRRRFLNVRNALDADVRRDADLTISRRLLQLLEEVRLRVQGTPRTTMDAAKRPCVAMYRAFRGEVDIGRIAGELRVLGWKTVFPVTHRATGHMSFRIVDDATTWRQGAYGIAEPEGGEEVPAKELQVVLLPGVAFTMDGYRLGYGGGYYDRLFANGQVHGCRIAVSYACQMAEQLPVEPHDVQMDYLVTEEGVSTCRRLR